MKKFFLSVFLVGILGLAGLVGYAAETPKVYLQDIFQAAPKPTDKAKARVMLVEGGVFKGYSLMSTSTGPPGPVGPQGNPGVAGPAGPQGAQGLPGLSLNWRGSWVGSPTGYVANDAIERNGSSYRALIYSSGVDPATDTLYQYWYPVALKGAQGATGATGPAGPAGAQGIQGIQGLQGATGAQGIQGPAGPQGATGLTGSQGPQGPVGPKGDKGDQGIGWDAAKLATFTNISGTTISTKNNLTSHTGNTSNPHSVTKTQVGLSNVDNTSDLSKPVSTAVQAALDLKAAATDPRFPTTAEKGAMTAAAAPSADNPFATRADLAFVNYSATAVSVVSGGAATGTLHNTHGANDTSVYQVQEAAGTPGFDVRFAFAGAGHFNQVATRFQYNGSTTHDIYMQIYNYGTLQWDALHPTPMHGTTSYAWVSFAVPDNTAYVSGGAAQVRFYHTTAGNPAHALFVDYIVLQHSTMGGATTLHSQLAGRSGADQHPTSAITGLDMALAGKEPADSTIIKEGELSSATNSTSVTTAANSAAVKAAYDLANGKLSPTGDGSGLTGLNASALASGTVGAARLPAASTTTQGAMSAADKKKSDSIKNLVTDYAADNTGAADTKAAWEAWYNALPATGGVLEVPDGIYNLSATPAMGVGSFPDTTRKPIEIRMSPGVRFSGPGTMALIMTNSFHRVLNTSELSTPTGGTASYGNATRTIEVAPDSTYVGNAVALYTGAVSPTSGTGDLWSINPLLTVRPGFGGHGLAAEIDFNELGTEFNASSTKQRTGLAVMSGGWVGKGGGWGVNIDSSANDNKWYLPLRIPKWRFRGAEIGTPPNNTTPANIVIAQDVNNTDALLLYRKTDTSSLGYLLRARNAADTTDLFSVDTTGKVTASYFVGDGSLLTNLPTGGTGDVIGPGSATDNAVVRFDSTTGKLLKNSTVTITDTGNLTSAGKDIAISAIFRNESSASVNRDQTLKLTNYYGPFANTGSGVIQMTSIGGSTTTPRATEQYHPLFQFFGTGAKSTSGTSISQAHGFNMYATAESNWTASDNATHFGIQLGYAGSNGNYRNVFNIASSGNVGIGTTSPGEKLEVAGNIKASTYIISGHEDQTASYTVSKDSSKITLASATATVTLPASLSAGHVAVTVAVAGAAASGVSFAAGSGGSVSWGDAGAPTFTNSKTADVVCHSQNTAATTTAAWRCVKGGNY